jgi:hypothetical protein
MTSSERSPIQDVKLADSPQTTWGNTILYRLALALGVVPAGDGMIEVDPDDILEQAEEHIRAWADDRVFTTDYTLTTADPVEQIVYTGNVPFGMATEHLTDEL